MYTGRTFRVEVLFKTHIFGGREGEGGGRVLRMGRKWTSGQSRYSGGGAK